MRIGNLKLIVIAASVVWAAGCSTTSTTDDSGSATDQSQMSGSDATASGTDGAGMSQGSMGKDGMSKADMMELSTVFYFDFDKAVIHSEDFQDLNAHAKYLLANPDASLVLEGHADERGTREYNIALGERRAKAVARYLSVQGVSSSQIEVVSYGEERPAMMGHNETAWAKNRRVELKY